MQGVLYLSMLNRHYTWTCGIIISKFEQGEGADLQIKGMICFVNHPCLGDIKLGLICIRFKFLVDNIHGGGVIVSVLNLTS